MRTEIIWAEVHSPIFMGSGPGPGINLGLKLDPKARKGLKLEYDEEKKHLFVSLDGKTVRVPETSVLSMVEAAKDSPVGKIHEVHGKVPPASVIFDPSAAQVETPMSHVHAGPGKGKTGVGGKVK